MDVTTNFDMAGYRVTLGEPNFERVRFDVTKKTISKISLNLVDRFTFCWLFVLLSLTSSSTQVAFSHNTSCTVAACQTHGICSCINEIENQLTILAFNKLQIVLVYSQNIIKVASHPTHLTTTEIT